MPSQQAWLNAHTISVLPAREVPITVRISGSSLDLSPKSTTDLDFIGQIRDLHGKLLGGVRDEIKLKLTEENAAQLARASPIRCE